LHLHVGFPGRNRQDGQRTPRPPPPPPPGRLPWNLLGLFRGPLQAPLRRLRRTLGGSRWLPVGPLRWFGWLGRTPTAFLQRLDWFCRPLQGLCRLGWLPSGLARMPGLGRLLGDPLCPYLGRPLPCSLSSLSDRLSAYEPPERISPGKLRLGPNISLMRPSTNLSWTASGGLLNCEVALMGSR
jgi:hypothetical protein